MLLPAGSWARRGGSFPKADTGARLEPLDETYTSGNAWAEFSYFLSPWVPHLPQDWLTQPGGVCFFWWQAGPQLTLMGDDVGLLWCAGSPVC